MGGAQRWFPPKETISTYRQIIYYLAEKLDMQVDMVPKKTYSEMDKITPQPHILKHALTVSRARQVSSPKKSP